MEPNNMETTDETALIPDTSDTETAREKFEQGRLSRRAALRKMGLTTGMALFSMFAVDDLARIAIKKMEQDKQTREVAETVAKEFKNSGIAFASTGGSSSYTHSSPSDPCEVCITVYDSQVAAALATFIGCIEGTNDPNVQNACVATFDNNTAAYYAQEAGCLSNC